MDALQSVQEYSGWGAFALGARVSSEQRHTRFEAGSPNQEEIDAYRELLHAHVRNGHAVVLGMTPELRNMALRSGFYVTCIDNSAAAHETYGDWVQPPWSDLEARLQGNWLDLERWIPQGCDAIVGDGVFGNVIGLEAHRALLRALRSTLSRDGVLVLRHALVPDDVESGAYEAERLVQRFRANEICAGDFGLGMRLWGSYQQAFDKDAYLLDNSIAFERYDEWLAEECLSIEERLVIGRYQFAGKNMLLPAQVWEALLTEAGFSFSVRKIDGGKLWYDYYPLYRCYLD